MMRWLPLLLMLLAPGVFAQDAGDMLTMDAITLTTDEDGGQTYGVSLQILLLMSALTFIPASAADALQSDHDRPGDLPYHIHHGARGRADE